MSPLELAGAALRSELRKVGCNRGLRRLAWAVVVASVGLAALTSSSPDAADAAVGASAGGMALYSGFALIPYAAALMGSAIVTSEFTSGVSTVLYSWVPQRWPIVAGKAVVAFLVGVALGALAIAAAWGGIVLTGGEDPRAVAAPVTVLGALLSTGFMGLLGVAVGALARRTQAAVLALITLLLVVPVLAGAVSARLPWLSSALDLLPMQAANTIVAAASAGGTPTVQTAVASAFVALAAWSFLGIGAAIWAVGRTDV